MADCNSHFESVSIVLLAVNERESLRCVIETINNTCFEKDIKEIYIFLKSKECASFLYSDSIINEYPYLPIKKYIQKGKNLIESFYEIPKLINGSHFIIMASDMEMNPDCISTLIEKSKKSPQAIISASKWHKDSIVKNYDVLRCFASKIINNFVKRLYKRDGSDFFSFFEIYPMKVFNEMHFCNTNNFLFEYTLKPLAKGVDYFEIPMVTSKRKEMYSNFGLVMNFIAGFRYLCTAVRVKYNERLYRKKF